MSDQARAKKLYLEDNLTMEAIAQELGVSRRTIERWSANDPEGKWTDLKLAQKVVLFERPGGAEHPRRERQDEPVKVRSRRQRSEIDELEIIELAISDLSATLGSGETDSRSLGGIAGALVRLLEYRRKICPPTAAELAEQVLALGVNPTEFTRELREKWQLRA